jgi:Uma2 family endonuclease
MVQTSIRTESPALGLRLRVPTGFDDEQFFALCMLNSDLRIERTAEGDLDILPPTTEETGGQNAALTTLLTTWAWRDGTGKAYDSSTGFRLPNGATRAPDAAWVLKSRLTEFTPEQRRKGFLPLVPDFVIELRSPSDSLRGVRAKMREYIENGVRLGWLLDPAPRRVYVYRPNAEMETLDDPAEVSADPELPGFVLNLRLVWDGELQARRLR